ncbi:endospore germination permease [Paenibacillus allorhizosphaerae]|uniref:Spore germination protein YndE n=1 Tax=Paenibacillus allorhizosphaerae TaxID=2849866 RepID=A0ABM8VD18_9BACL|nr:endospore germination permease [Paenibacillus allorhizosphaerae]CAG7626141.1 Spore germination protein YndE [Paenibacillus allorhizosphaerae]
MKLSGSQLFWIIVTTEVIAMIGLRISPAIVISKQDAWISMLIGGGIGAAFTYLFVHLSTLHPNQTLTKYSQAMLGKWLGRIIVLPYLVVWYMLSAALLRSFADFLHLILVDSTPLWMIMVLLIGVTIYMVYSAGIMGIGRFCEIMGPIIFLTLIVSFILNVGNVNWHHVLPVYFDSGWLNILKGSFAPAFWFSGPFTTLVIVSFMQEPQKALSKSVLGVVTTAFLVFASTLMVLLIFGPNLSAKIRFPYFMYVRTIDILNFIQNVDIFIMFIWIFGVSAQLSLYLFIASYELTNWFSGKSWRRTIWFGAPAVYILALLIPDETTLTLYDKLWSSMIFPVCGVGIPLLLWIISVFKKNSVKQ